MHEADSIRQIRDLIRPILIAQNIDLIDLEFKGNPGNHILRIFVDMDGGIKLDRCATLSREISDLLDTKDLIPGKYRLELSSPGLDRPLKTPRDFQRNAGRKVKINYLVEGDEVKTITGTIAQVDEHVVLFDENKNQIKIEIAKIVVAKVIPAW